MTPQSPTPWLLDKRWHDGKVIDGMGSEVALAWFLVGFMGMFTAGCLLGFIKHKIPLNDFPVVIAVAIPFLELVLIFQALRKTAQWLRFGRSVFEMATFPGVIGGQLVGIVYTKVRLEAQDGFHVSLACVHRVWSGQGNSAHRNDIVVWHDEQHLVRGAMEQDMTRTAIPIGFRIPRNCLPSFHAAGYDEVAWKLRVRAKVPGIDYEANFEVPVFITPDSDHVPSATVDPVAPYRAVEVRTGPTGKGVRFWKDAAGTVHASFRAGRNLKISMLVSTFAVITTSVTYFLWQQPKHDLFSRFILETMIGGFALMSLLLLIVSFLMLFQRKDTAVDSREVVITTRYLGLAFTRRINSKDVRDIQMKKNMSTADNEWFEIDILGPAGQKFCAGSGIEKNEAIWLVEQMTQAITPTPK